MGTRAPDASRPTISELECGARELRATAGATAADVARYRVGDRDAFEAIWKRYERGVEVIVAACVRSVRNAHARRWIDPRDVVQEMAATVLRKLGEFEYRGPGSLAAWFEAIARNAVREQVHRWEAAARDPRRVRSSDAARDGGAALDAIARAEAGPRTRLIRCEDLDRVARALSELDERRRRIVVLRTYFGAEWGEIAAEIGATSADAVRKEFTGKALPDLAAALRRIG